MAVGGTTLGLNTDNTWKIETSWGGSSSGISAYEPQPSYQSSVVSQSKTKRTNPDVSYDANPNTGLAVYDSTISEPDYPSSSGAEYGWSEFGGTSVGAPQWAALSAIADQGRNLVGESPIDANDPQEALKIFYASSRGVPRHHDR